MVRVRRPHLGNKSNYHAYLTSNTSWGCAQRQAHLRTSAQRACDHKTMEIMIASTKSVFLSLLKPPSSSGTTVSTLTIGRERFSLELKGVCNVHFTSR